MSKICKKCQQEKPLNAFEKGRAVCRKCRNADPKRIIKNRERARKNRQNPEFKKKFNTYQNKRNKLLSLIKSELEQEYVKR